MDANGGTRMQVCREYLRGECDRGNNCKFSHPNPEEACQEFEDKICRDYLRDECVRGDKCIYKHPMGMKGTKKVVKFCHNYQNGKCPRVGCSYLHCSSEEEEYYNKTGKLPPGLDDTAKMEQNSKVCKDFLNGKCFRSQCKFVHPGPDYREGGSSRKRPMPPWDDREFYPPMREDRERIRSLMHLVDDLEDENTVLRHKLSRMHRQVLDLTEDNKILLDENRRLRGSDVDGSRPPLSQRRADAGASDVGSLDSYLRVPSVTTARVPAALDPVSTRAARGTTLDTERLHSFDPEQTKFAKYDY